MDKGIASITSDTESDIANQFMRNKRLIGFIHNNYNPYYGGTTPAP